MYFDTLDALIHMDGHGVYVWSAYLITSVVVGFLLLAPRRRQQRFMRRLAGEIRRQQGGPQPGGPQPGGPQPVVIEEEA
jgi:heme exporter protein D